MSEESNLALPPAMTPRTPPEVAEGPLNKLLAELPSAEFARLRPRLERLTLKARRPLHLPGLPMTECYFPESGLVSVTADTDQERHAVGSWLVGSEGMVGAPVILGLETTPLRRTVLIEGTAWRISASDLRWAMDEVGALREILLRHIFDLLVETAQSAACNARHTISQRLARWLLSAHDRVSGNELRLTHATLARLLGVRRASVTEQVNILEKAGTIALARGTLRIIDRAKLEQTVCRCYRVSHLRTTARSLVR